MGKRTQNDYPTTTQAKPSQAKPSQAKPSKNVLAELARAKHLDPRTGRPEQSQTKAAKGINEYIALDTEDMVTEKEYGSILSFALAMQSEEKFIADDGLFQGLELALEKQAGELDIDDEKKDAQDSDQDHPHTQQEQEDNSAP